MEGSDVLLIPGVQPPAGASAAGVGSVQPALSASAFDFSVIRDAALSILCSGLPGSSGGSIGRSLEETRHLPASSGSIGGGCGPWIPTVLSSGIEPSLHRLLPSDRSSFGGLPS